MLSLEQRAWDLGKKTIVVESRGGLGGNVVWCGLAAPKIWTWASQCCKFTQQKKRID